MEPRLKKRLAVIGAGPIGVEAALLGLDAGFDVTVFEKDRIGAHLLKWGHVRFFSAVKNNASDRLWSALSDTPDPGAYLTGREFVEQVLKPASTSPLLNGRIREGCSVMAIARRRLTKNELPGHPLRAERPFQLLLRSSSGIEEIVEADIVLDAGGVYGKPNWTGESGLPCPGEKETNSIDRHLPDILGEERSRWAENEILLVGHGHSAATAAMWLGELTRSHANTRVHWVVKSDRSRPCHETANDPLPEREKTVRIANDLAERPPHGWKIYRKSSVLALKKGGKGIEAAVGRGEKKEVIQVNRILSLTGYRPDTSNIDELQVQVSPVTGGAFGLAKSLMSITDCLSPVVVPPENLSSGEPGFFFIGHKSYGRLNTFLLKSGLEQLEMIFKHHLGWKKNMEPCRSERVIAEC